MNVTLDQTSLPVLYQSEVVVAGGSLAGVAAALKFASSGRQVVLVEPRTYLGREVTATLRPWFNLTEANKDRLPTLIEACIRANSKAIGEGEIPLQPEIIKTILEDLLLAAGVKLLYASLPVGLLGSKEAGFGLIIGNKSGRQVLGCRLVVDATETALVARLGQAPFEPGPEGAITVARTLEFEGVGLLASGFLPVPAYLGMLDNRVKLHQGYNGPDNWLLECRMQLEREEDSGFGFTRLEALARDKTMQLASYLVSEEPAFNKAFLGATSYELATTYTSRLAGPLPAWAKDFEAITLNVPGYSTPPQNNINAAAFAGPQSGVWCLNEAARLEQGLDWNDPVTSSSVGAGLAQALIGKWETATFSPALVQAENPAAPKTLVSKESLQVKEPASPQQGRLYERRTVPALVVDFVVQSQVLVVGGGSSGATAARVAASEGLATVQLEMNPGLGGTGTYGGVDSYWFGRRVGFANEVKTLVEQVTASGRDRGTKWNIECKAYALLQASQANGVELVLNSLVIGTIVSANTVRGVVAATRTGLVAVLADITIDATGDGDVAAHAGAEFVYGAERDHVTMWYSLAQFGRSGRTKNNFTSMVDVSNIEDYTRAILAGRRRGTAGYDHGVYIAPRESRHIKGAVVLNLTDQLRHRRWPDAVYTAFSNHDIKGHSSSDWIRLGLIPPNLEVEIPYRALLPVGLNNILVVGKAISATHDALPAIRMQADMENLGGVAALAAAQAIRGNLPLPRIDIPALQTQLHDRGVLPGEALNRKLVDREYSEAELEAMLKQLNPNKPLYSYGEMGMEEVFRDKMALVELCCAGPRVIPLLERAMQEAEESNHKLLLARMLALLGSPSSLPVLLDTINSELSGDSLPELNTHISHAILPPDQGAMPGLAALLYVMGMVDDESIIPVYRRVIDLLAHNTEADIRSRDKGIFYYVDAVCLGIERKAGPATIPMLRQLHSYAPFRDQVCREGFQADFFYERQAYLELVIGRTLARCGSLEGFDVLIAYLDDVRALLAEHAHSELKAISGEDLGKDAEAWHSWLARQRFNLQPKPWLEPTEPQRAWGKLTSTRST